MLEVDNLALSFVSHEGETSLFRGVSFSFKAGDLIGVTGDSGTGKTGLLMALGGYLPYWSPACKMTGSISVCGEPVTQGQASNDTVIVIENPYNQNTGFKSSVFEELLVPLEMRGIPRELMLASARCVARRFGLSEISGLQLDSLSGGELQRLHIASALIARPNLLLLDQILVELDPAFQQRLFKILRGFAKECKAIALVSFNPGEVDFDRFDAVVTLPGLSQVRPEAFATVGAAFGQTVSRVPGNGPVLKIRDLYFRYSPQRPWLFEGLNLDVLQGEGCLVLGPNGSGKSTLGKLILGIVKPDRGSIVLDIGSTVNCAFQNPDLYFCKRTVQEELEFGTDKQWAAKLADLTGLSPYFNKNPYDLPRGFRKRLSFAIAASCRPAVLFLDEPSQYQDATGVAGLIKAMRFLLDQKTALLCCTHDRRIIGEFSDFSRITLGREPFAVPVSKAGSAPNSRPTHQCSPGLYGDKSDNCDTREWFQKTWSDAIDSWIDNDTACSTHGGNVVKLLIEKTSGSLSIGPGSRVLDIGCGDGKGLMALRKWLDESGLSKVPLLGIDVQPALIDHARWGSIGHANIKYEAADATDARLLSPLCRNALGGKATLITCIYVLHDEPDLFAMLKAISENIDENGHLVCILVHPEWTETLASKGFVKIVQKDSLNAGDTSCGRYRGGLTPNWRWLGLYPILGDHGRTIFLPHAFRTLGDYEKEIVNCGFNILSIAPIRTAENEISNDPTDFNSLICAEYKSIAYSAPPSVLIVAKKL